MREELNNLLTAVGPGTPMGELFRRFWLPVLLEEEVSEPDGKPTKFRILGEDLVAFRATDGRLGVLDAYCAHRRAGLIYGRNEDCGLRCIYHGWKFDVDGNTVDMPSEPPERQHVKEKIKIKSYPAVSRGGAVWIYMGPKNRIPPFPLFEWTRFPAEQRALIKRYQPCNYAQAVEGGIDSSHISFLHRTLGDKERSENRPDESINARYASRCTHPKFSVEETDYGLQILAKRWLDGVPDIYWRITQFMLPCFQMVPPILQTGKCKTNPTYGNVWVPIDDFNTWNFGFSSDVVPLTEEQRIFMGKKGIWGELDDNHLPLQNDSNNYGWSIERQREENFSGIEGVRNQDAAVVESMGPIVDRSKEHLGHSDSGVMKFRRLMIRLAQQLQEGREPEAPFRPELFNIRSVSVVLDENENVQDILPELAAGEPVDA